ncbi:MAG: 2OG-Fe(II) oxygenase [Acinetobacter sp.]|nr:MAG: 2OG-Fe(II) oxygenase [Acinetobacter sp.]
MSSLFTDPSWHMPHILNDIEQHGFSLVQNIYPEQHINAIRQECLENLQRFQAASIQNGVVSTIRSDHILWINEDLSQAYQHITTLNQLAQQFNQAFFWGIQDIEAHFACYRVGEFYALHRDNPQQKNERIISTVFYLHPEWQNGWGGELRLQDKHGEWHIILPRSNQLVIFQSDLLHEVLPAKQQRLSITAWLRQRPATLF